MIPALRFFNSEIYQKMITARRCKKEQMDPLIERTKVIYLFITVYGWMEEREARADQMLKTYLVLYELNASV